MKQIGAYITEKLHLRKDNDTLCTSDMKKFIDGFDDEDKRTIVHLIKKCLSELKQYEDWEDHWCYITKPEQDSDSKLKYLWSSNPDNDHCNIGDKTVFGNTILFIVKKGDEIPLIYKNLSK